MERSTPVEKDPTTTIDLLANDLFAQAMAAFNLIKNGHKHTACAVLHSIISTSNDLLTAINDEVPE